MIDKQDFYHGAAIIRLLEDECCKRIQKNDFGYVVNEGMFVFPKYSTKARSPWRFSFGDNEIKLLDSMATKYKKIVIPFICGGDGICVITWREACDLLDNSIGWISIRRNFNEQYGVAGLVGRLERKISLNEWPKILFNY